MPERFKYEVLVGKHFQTQPLNSKGGTKVRESFRPDPKSGELIKEELHCYKRGDILETNQELDKIHNSGSIVKFRRIGGNTQSVSGEVQEESRLHILEDENRLLRERLVYLESQEGSHTHHSSLPEEDEGERHPNVPDFPPANLIEDKETHQEHPRKMSKWTREDLENQSVQNLLNLAHEEEISIPKKVTKEQLINILLES